MTSWFFIEMAAKSALICSIAMLLAMALRGRAAADRATVLRVGMGLLILLPFIDLAFPILQIEAFAAPAAASANMTAAEVQALLLYADSLPAAETTIWDDPTPLFLILWAAGAGAVLLRLVAGVATLRRWTRAAEPVTDPYWLEALERARIASGASDRLRLMVSDHVPGPLGWGWRNPVVLIDHDTYAEAEEADAILAHEIAHVARLDWPALMMNRVATALFWFNPLVWAVAREAVQQAEEAADAHAARVVEPIRYAETLLSWGQIGRGIGVPANSIAPGAHALSRRVKAVLDARLLERSARSRIAIVAVLLCVGVAAPVAALELVEEARPAPPPAPPAPPALAGAALLAPEAPPKPPLPPRAKAAGAPERPMAPPAPGDAEVPEVPEVPELPELPELGPVMAELRIILPRIPHLVGHSLQAVDTAELERRLEAAGIGRLSREQVREAMERARTARIDAEQVLRNIKPIDPKEVEARVRAAMPDRLALRRQIHTAMAASRGGMEEGARPMERGADRMMEQSRRLRSREERERIIERERQRGRTVTHEELLDAADGLAEGARNMRKGAEQMRRSMRSHGHHN